MSEITEPVTGEPITTPDAPETAEPKPTETVEFWKQKSREQEARAKANAEAAQKLAALEDAQKTEAQRQADAMARAQREAEEARAEALAYKVAASHGVTPEYFDLLGRGDEETISARAERIGELLKSRSETEQLKADIEALRTGKPAPSASRPVADLKPGATPVASKSDDDIAYEAVFGPS